MYSFIFTGFVSYIIKKMCSAAVTGIESTERLLDECFSAITELKSHHSILLK